MIRFRVGCFLFSLLILAVPGALAQQPKFNQSATIELKKGCGSGLDQDSAIGTCVRGPLGVAVTKAANGGHVCVQLPPNLTDKDVSIEPSASVGTGTAAGGGFQICGNGIGAPGVCAIQWSRFEAREYYPDTNRVCGRFKNWSADRDITVRIRVFQP
jgi:hypothetical protein